LLDEKAIEIVITALLASFGAVARMLNQKDKIPIQVANMLSGCLIASFTGLIAHLSAVYFNLDQFMVYVIAGISGWMGPQVLDIFINIIMKKTGLELQAAAGQQPDLKVTSNDYRDYRADKYDNPDLTAGINNNLNFREEACENPDSDFADAEYSNEGPDFN